MSDRVRILLQYLLPKQAMTTLIEINHAISHGKVGAANGSLTIDGVK